MTIDVCLADNTPDSGYTDFADMLGVELTSSGFAHLGHLSQDSCEDLLKLCDACPLSSYVAEQRLKKNPEDFRFLPMPFEEVGNLFFGFIGDNGYFDSPGQFPNELYDLVPRLRRLEKTDCTFLRCDFFGLHTDKDSIAKTEACVLLILLHAPKGCNLVTNGTYQHHLKVGDVVLIDDQIPHGVFPLERTEYVDIKKLKRESREFKDQFVQRNCMAWMIVTKRKD
ncbi:hypothetical protein ACI2KR_26920 [Pseudomonas luteola]